MLSLNLYDFIKENNFRGLSLGLIRKFAVQILQSLVVLRQHSIIHCDLKPENILLKQPNRSGIKLIDFGSSCFSDEKIYTYIQSRFYRAPEIMMAIPYTTAIDIWSFACILAELFTGFPLFPGESEPEQMALIMEVNGLPPKELLDQATRKDVFFDADGQPLPSTNFREGERQPGSKTLAQALKCQDTDFVDFLNRCFIWAPDRRITPEQALEHPWIVKGFPQLAPGGGMQRSNGSLCVEKGESARNTLGLAQAEKYFSTHNKDPKAAEALVPSTSTEKLKAKKKPGLNQSLVNPAKVVHSTANLVNVNLAVPTNKEGVLASGESKLQDKLLKLKAKLKLMTTKTGTVPRTTKNADRTKDKKGFVFNVAPKKSTLFMENTCTYNCVSTTNKQSLKQSSIF